MSKRTAPTRARRARCPSAAAHRASLDGAEATPAAFRTREQAEINRLRDLLDVAQQAAHLGYWTYDYALAPDDPNAQWSEAFYYSPDNVAISGLTQDTVSRMTTREMAERYVRAEDRDIFIANLTAFASGRIDRHQTDYVWFHPDGRELFIRSTGIRHRGPDGEPLQATGIVQDLTERRAAERAIREQAEALRTAELTLIQAQKGEALGNLAGGIAHDFHNVLAIINGYVELSTRHVDEPAILQRNLEKIRESIAAGKETIAQILAFSRKAEQVLSVVDLRAVIDNTIMLLQHSLPPEIGIECRAAAGEFHASANETLLQQAVVNLCNNAVQAMPEGGKITIRLDRLHLAEPRSNLGCSVPDGDYVALHVEDTGVGIPAELRTAIFDPFVTTKPSNRGTGLGLAIVQKTVKSFGGLIDFESEVGRGTTFRILLPPASRTPVTRKPAVEAPRAEPAPSGGGRILLLDDEAGLTDSGSHMLGGLGYEVTTSNDPMEALRMIREDPTALDLVVTDLKMPNMSGQKFIAEALAIRPDMPFVVVSGYGELRLADAAIRRAVKSVLEKPVSFGLIAQAVTLALQS